MKKLIYLSLLTATMVFVAGCGQKPATPAPTATATPEITVAPTPTKELSMPTATPKPDITVAPTEAEPTPTEIVSPGTPSAFPSATPVITATPSPIPLENVDMEGPNAVISAADLPLIDGATATLPFYRAIVANMLDVNENTASGKVLCSTTAGAFTNLINKKVDMILSAYPSEAQVQEAAAAGVEFEYHKILNGAFVFLVSADNPVDNLTTAQLQDIYRGKITNWKEVGGNDCPIVAYQREEGSGSQTGLYRFLLDKSEVAAAPSEYMINSMNGLVFVIRSSYNNGASAIGYSYYYYVAIMNSSEGFKLLSVDGVQPNNETISNGSYPFLNTVVAVVRKGTPATDKVYEVIDYMLSDKGASIATDLGYVVNRQAIAE